FLHWLFTLYVIWLGQVGDPCIQVILACWHFNNNLKLFKINPKINREQTNK
ncbi:hypothetical protein M153_7320003, partial [Pseudoloma neurophilia]